MNELTPEQELALHAEFTARLNEAESWPCVQPPTEIFVTESPVEDLAAELGRVRDAFVASFGIPPRLVNATVEGVIYSGARIAPEQFRRSLLGHQ